MDWASYLIFIYIGKLMIFDITLSIANKMSLNMFEEIKKYIHFIDPNKEYEKNDRRYNPLQKINPIWDKIMENC